MSTAAALDGAVSLRDVGKTYANGVVALDRLDLDVRPGEFVSLLGPSGCGKSTALRIIAGLSEPTGGSVIWPQPDTPHKPREIGFVFQEPTLMPWATVAGNVRLPLDLQHIDAATAPPRIDAALATAVTMRRQFRGRRSIPTFLFTNCRV